jgi:predicted enzyme related to lactoylglutathione lyase
METTVSTRGRFLWFDLMTPDTSAAQTFYKSVMGWGTEDWPGAPEGMTYTMWTAGGAPIGGSVDLATLEEPAPPHWLTHIGTDDLDQTLRNVEANGGTALAPAKSLPDVGRYAPIRDPQGAVFMAYEPASAEPFAMAKDGQVSWNELATTDVPAALTFYRAVFGWNENDAVDMGEDGVIEQMQRLGELRDLGVMTDQEFALHKSRLLDR